MDIGIRITKHKYKAGGLAEVIFEDRSQVSSNGNKIFQYFLIFGRNC